MERILVISITLSLMETHVRNIAKSQYCEAEFIHLVNEHFVLSDKSIDTNYADIYSIMIITDVCVCLYSTLQRKLHNSDECYL